MRMLRIENIVLTQFCSLHLLSAFICKCTHFYTIVRRDLEVVQQANPARAECNPLHPMHAVLASAHNLAFQL